MVALFITDNWGYTKGGINTVNYELCKSLALKEDCKVFCAVLKASQEVLDDAKKLNVTIINIDSQYEFFIKNDVYKIWHDTDIIFKDEFVWVIGHDVITGEIAIQLDLIYKNKNIQSECAIIHHMDYSKYTCFKKTANKGAKISKQDKVLRYPKVLMAIGPRLYKSAKNKNENKVYELVPGINFDNVKINTLTNVDDFDIVVSGRITQEDDIIKQGSLVIQAFALASKDVINNGKLSLIGADEKEIEKFRSLAYTKSGKKLVINAYEYTTDRNNYIEQLKRKQLCIMPSLEEGFGLVAWEAIGLGVPVVIASNSGISEFFMDNPGYKGYVSIVETNSTSDVTNTENLKKCIIDIYKNYDQYKKNAIELQRKLKAEFTWEAATDNLLSILTEESNIEETKKNASANQMVNEASISDTFKQSIGDLIADYMQQDFFQYASEVTYNNSITFEENCNLWIGTYSDFSEPAIIEAAKKARKKAFDTKYGNYNYDNDLRVIYKDTWFEPIKQYIESVNKRGKRILGVGSNNGYELMQIFEPKPKAKLHVLDISDVAIKNGKKSYSFIQFTTGCMEEPLPAPATFDMYLNLRSIHSRGVDLRKALSECKRILKPEGIAIFSVANGYLSVEKENKEVLGMYDNDLNAIVKNTPYIIVEKIRSKLEFYGFSDIEIHTGKSEIFIKAVKR